MRIHHFALTAFVAAALGAGIPSAYAADMPVKAAPRPLVAAYNWTGFYGGIQGGYGWARTSQTNIVTAGTTGDFSGSGGLIGGTIGYNWQISNWLLGIEGDYAWAHIESNTFQNCPTGCNNRLEGFGTVRGRLGVIWGPALVYGTGGAAFGHIKSWSDGSSGTDNKTGWTAGGGVEWMFTPRWSAKVEYLYARFGSSFAYSVPATVQNDYLRVNMVRVGVNYRFAP